MEIRHHESEGNQVEFKLTLTSPKSHALMEETEDAKATFAPEWNESVTRERILPRLRLLFSARRISAEGSRS